MPALWKVFFAFSKVRLLLRVALETLMAWLMLSAIPGLISLDPEDLQALALEDFEGVLEAPSVTRGSTRGFIGPARKSTFVARRWRSRLSDSRGARAHDRQPGGARGGPRRARRARRTGRRQRLSSMTPRSSSALSTVRSRLKVVASRLLTSRSDATKQQSRVNAGQSVVQAAINAAFDLLKFAMYRLNKFYTRIARCCRSRTCSLHRSSAPCSEAGSSEPCSQKFGAVLRNRNFCVVIEGRKLCAALRGPAS